MCSMYILGLMNLVDSDFEIKTLKVMPRHAESDVGRDRVGKTSRLGIRAINPCFLFTTSTDKILRRFPIVKLRA